MMGGFGPAGPHPSAAAAAAAMSGFPHSSATHGFPFLPMIRPGMDLAGIGIMDRLANET